MNLVEDKEEMGDQLAEQLSLFSTELVEIFYQWLFLLDSTKSECMMKDEYIFNSKDESFRGEFLCGNKSNSKLEGSNTV